MKTCIIFLSVCFLRAVNCEGNQEYGTKGGRRVGNIIKKAIGPELRILESGFNRTKNELLEEAERVEFQIRKELIKAQDAAAVQALEWKKNLQKEVSPLIQKWLNDDNLQSAYSAYGYWREKIENSRVKKLIKDLGISDVLSESAATALRAKIPPQAQTSLAIAFNVTAEIAADVVEDSSSTSTRWDIMVELAEYAQDVDTSLHSMVETRALGLICPKAYHKTVTNLVKARVVPRLFLTNVAALLHGMDSRTDPLLNALIGCYSLEHITQGMALAVLAVIDDVVGDCSNDIKSFASRANKWLDGGLSELIEMGAGENISCDKIAKNAFDFFEELSKSYVNNSKPQVSPESHPKRVHFWKKWTMKSTNKSFSNSNGIVIQRNASLSRPEKVALNMARIMRRQGKLKRKKAKLNAEKAYLWGGMYVVYYPENKENYEKYLQIEESSENEQEWIMLGKEALEGSEVLTE